MINLLKKYKWILIFSSIPFIFYVLIMTITVPYVAYLPGDITPVEKVVSVETNYENEGSYNSTSVYSITNITIFQKLIYGNMKDTFVVEKTETEKTLSIAEENIRGKIEHESAIFSSLISAYSRAGKSITYSFKGLYVYYTIDKTNMLKIGDVILGSSKEDITNRIYSYDNSLGINILRNNEEITIKPETLKNFTLAYEFYEILDTEVAYEVYASNSQGPSAGFMQALALFDDLTEYDYTNGLKIAGTGTIDTEGNVGAIGAVGLKIYTAYYNNVDIFFVPTANYEEALKTYNYLDTDMKLVVIDNLDEAISYLGGYQK